MAKNTRSEIETELKIKVSREDLEALFEYFSKRDGAGRLSHKFLPRAYYDTADLALHEAGLSLRVQYKPGKAGKVGAYEQTVKFEIPSGAELSEGMLQRKECKDIIESPQPDIENIGDADADAAISSFKNKKLKHIFTAAIERRYFNLDVSSGKNKGVVELAFDVGNMILQPDGESFQFYEIEIEVKSGSPAMINAVRDKILKLAPSAEIQPLSKAQQGVNLYRKRKTP